jgi:hypothetical protein
MAGAGSFADGSELSRNDLRLPFRIEGHGQDRAAVAAKKLEHRDCRLRGLVTGSKGHNDDIGCGRALWAQALANGVGMGHWILVSG